MLGSVFKCMVTFSVFSIIYPQRVFLLDIPIKDNSIITVNYVKSAINNKNESLEYGLDLSREQMQKFKIWPRGLIPYFIDDFSFDKVLRDRIRLFLEETSGQTGLQFVELPSPQEDEVHRWVFFINRRGQLGCGDCTASNFTNTGVQKVVLGYDCLGGGELAAIVLALVGVPPQHNSPDRDDYIKIIEENIIPDKKHLFNILKDDDWLFDDIEYDFASAGHYEFYKYTFNGQATIKPIEKVDFTVGDVKGFSPTDILKIKKLYQYIIQKRKPSMTEDCSKLFKPGKNFNKQSKQQDLSK